ncbi:MAG: type VI secretion system Vgr family protein [Nannocystaceae bacterium]|nr:type VI secretion system tip protein VgrG [bacterium]
MSLPSVSISFDADNLANEFRTTGFKLDERLDAPFEMRLEVCVDDHGFEPGSLLGEPVTVLIERATLSRDVHGIVVAVTEGSAPNVDKRAMTLEVRPAWCALGQRKSARIFQEMTVVEIVGAVAKDALAEYGRQLDTSHLTATYPLLEYTVQLDETDQAFVERLLQAHGIGYLFDHSGSAEAVVLFDDISSFGTLESVSNTDGVLPVRGEEEIETDGAEYAWGYELLSRVRPTTAAVQVFDWRAPGSVALISNTDASQHDDLDRPVDGATRAPERVVVDRDEPAASLGERSAAIDIDRLTAFNAVARERQRRDAAVGRGASVAILMRPGVRISLSEHPDEALDATYVCTHVVHRWGRLGKGKRAEYENDFRTLPAGVTWRPDRAHAKPRIHGIQTATVVGNDGEEIHTDPHGRIKVQFHWDTAAVSNAGTSCYLRVMQSLAGNGWGAMFLPRVGMEVVVSFIDGDPDRPVVTGCLYNGTHDPPYELDANKTRTVLKTQSTGATGGYNELSFEDAGGSEEVYMRAQKDLREDVLNDHATDVGNDQSNTVHGNQTEEVDLDQSTTVHQSRTLTVDVDNTETVGGNEVRRVTGNVREDIGGNEHRAITGNAALDVTGNLDENVAGSYSNTTAGAHSTSATGSISTTTPSTHSLSATGGITLTTSAGCDIVAPTGLTVTGAGVTLVDNNYFSVAATSGTVNGQATSLVGYSLGGTILKTDFGVVSTAVNGVNLAANGVDLAAKGVGDEKVGCDLKTAGTSIKTAATNVWTSAITMLL